MKKLLFLAAILATSPVTASGVVNLECTLDWDNGKKVDWVGLSESTSEVVLTITSRDRTYKTTEKLDATFTPTTIFYEFPVGATGIYKKVQIDRSTGSYQARLSIPGSKPTTTGTCKVAPKTKTML